MGTVTESKNDIKEGSKIKVLIITLAIFSLSVYLGCASFQEVLTPTYISQAAIEYADVNVPEFLPYNSLWDAKKVAAEMDYKYSIGQVTDEMEYNHLRGLITTHIGRGEAFRDTMFSPEGPIGLLIPASLAGILGTFAGGRYVKSPREKELEKKVNGESA